MKQRQSPEIINLSEDKLNEIKTRFESGSILDDDKKIILSILSGYLWIQRQLHAKKLGIHRLRNLFGFNTEKRSKLNEKTNDNSPINTNDSSDLTEQNDISSGGNAISSKKNLNGIWKKTMVE